MTIDDALLIVDSVLPHKSLSNVQELIFRYTWEGKTYLEIAEIAGYDSAYIRDVGYKLWQVLSKAFGERVTKNNLQVVLRRYAVRVGNGRLQNAISGMMTPQVAPTTSPSIALLPDAPSRDITSDASKLLNQLSRILSEPFGDRYLQQISETYPEPSVKLTITLKVSMAD
ncbi:hypothetical protein TUMEXPCC7403_09385 [Tumidithrix helvetica PCC 7403]|uniref:hypothetical protein n=1 Tax=Tumidithrix helvetica TaxID=3457545 RepID=UPI003CA480CE